ncbi:hypothetical protein OCS_06287 [Ophiocordyceps sinensis CO18]|nr:hypothetical protein OCS_06287 [Ophiocordyceps sinensis CO18]
MTSENKAKFPGCLIVPWGSMELDPAGNAWLPTTEYFCKRKASWFSTPEDTERHQELPL